MLVAVLKNHCITNFLKNLNSDCPVFWLTSPTVTWEMSSDTRLTYELEYTHQSIPQDRGVIAIDGKLGFQPIETFTGSTTEDIDTDVVGH